MGCARRAADGARNACLTRLRHSRSGRAARRLPGLASLASSGFALFAALTLAREPAPAQPPSALLLDSLIAMNTEALGGAAALGGVETMRKLSRISEGENRDTAVFVTDRGGRMRVDIFVGAERVFAESYDGERAHQWRPGEGQSPASARGTIALSHTPQLPNHIFRLRDIAANGHQLAIIDEDVLDDRAYAVLKLTLSDGFETYLWLDRESGLVTRSRNTRALHVDVDATQRVIENRMSDFRQVGKIRHPHRVVEVDLGSGATLVEIELLDLQLNMKLPPDYFTNLNEAPADIPAD